MIFITLGSQKFQFNRLLKAIDAQVQDRRITDEVFAQTGASDYEPLHYEHRPFLDRNEFAALITKADIVITHGGTGAIIGAIKKGKKVIAVPRLAKFGEHVDDHQLQLIDQFDELELIYKCEDCDKLWRAIQEVKSKNFNVYRSNTEAIVSSIESFIKGEITK